MVSTFPPHPAGASDYFNRLSKELNQRAEIVALADITKSTNLRDPSYRILRVWRPNSIKYPFKILSLVLSFRPDIAHINHEYMLYGKPLFSFLFPLMPFLIRLTQIKVVITMHSVVPRDVMDDRFFHQYGGGKGLSFLKKVAFIFVTKAIATSASKIIVHSQYSQKILVNDYRVNGDKIAVFPHGMDKARMYGQLKAKKFLALKNKKIVLFFGFVSRKKGLKHLISAMPLVLREHKDACLVIAGGPYPSLFNDYKECVDEVKSLINDLNLQETVTLTESYIPNDFAPIYFDAADVVVLPHTEVFGASGVLTMAAIHAKPVVVTDHPIFEYYVKNGINGLIVRRGDSKELAEGILKILSDESMKLKLGKNLSKHANASSWNKIADMHLELYYSLIR